MSNKTRQRLWPVSLVMAVAIIGVAAALLVVASSPSSSEAHGGVSGPTHCDDLDQFGQLLHDSLNDHTCATGPGNTAPTAVSPNPLMGGIAAPGDDIMVDVSGAFRDDDGDSLTFTATSSDSNVATVSVTGSVVTVTIASGASGGATATITVTASDGTDTAMQTFVVTVTAVEPPMNVSVSHGGQAGQLEVSWEASTSAGVVGYEITYRELPSGTTMAVEGRQTSPYTITGLDPGAEYVVCVIAVAEDDGNEIMSAPACGNATTSRYLLTFDIRPTDQSPRRTDPEDFVQMVDVDGPSSLTVRATLWVPAAVVSEDDTDTVAVRLTGYDNVRHSNLLAVAENSIDDGELTIRPRDGDKRSFQLQFQCVPGQDLTVTIHGDQSQQVEIGTVACRVREAIIRDIATDACYSVTAADAGDRSRDDEGIQLYQTDASVAIRVTSNQLRITRTTTGTQAQIDAGTATIEVAAEACPWPTGAVYIRFVDQFDENMPIVDDSGGFVDESGFGDQHGEVIGLDSHGKLLLNVPEESFEIRATDGTTHTSMRRSGIFRVFTPEAAMIGDQYYVEAYDEFDKERQVYSLVRYVEDPNRPNTDPTTVSAIGPVSVTAGMMSQAMDVSAYFSDADGDMLTYQAMSSNDMIATAAVSGSMVTITGVAAGEATITVTASDGMGGTNATQTIAVTVTAAMLMAPSNVRATQNGNMVTIEWDGGENADTFTVALLTRKDDGSWDIPNAVYDQNVAGSPHPVNMATRPAGTYLVGVAAGTDDGEWTSWVTISLDYQPNGGPPPIG